MIFCAQYRSIFNHCDIVSLFGQITQNKGYYAIQGHRCLYESKACMRLPISDQY